MSSAATRILTQWVLRRSSPTPRDSSSPRNSAPSASRCPSIAPRSAAPGSSPRARDFFDIHNLVDQFSLILTTREFLRLVQVVFQAKRVPIALLWRIEETREFHRTDFQAVLDTVPPGVLVLTFDEYADSLARLVRTLQALRDE